MRETGTIGNAVEPNAQAPIQDQWRRGYIIAIIAACTFMACYLRDFVLPSVPVMLWADQILYATNGTRMIAGQMPYRDFFEFLPAGTDLVYAGLFRAFGVYLWIPNLVMVVLATSSVVLVTLAARKVLRGAAVVLPALFAVGFGLYGGLDATHHWFSTVAALAAMVVLLHGTGWRYVAVAGFLCGVTASFTQSKGAAVTLGFLIYLLWKPTTEQEPAERRWRRCLVLCGAALVSFLPVNGYYIVKLGFEEWCRWVIVFPFRYYPTVPGQTWSAPIMDFRNHTGLMKWIGGSFLYVAVPMTYIGSLYVMRRERGKDRSQPWDGLLLISITGISMFLAVTPSLSIMRASAVSFPATILLGWGLEHWSQWLRWVKIAAVFLSIVCATDMALSTQRIRWNYLDLPAGRTAIREPGKYELYLWMKEHTHPGQDYFGISTLSLPLWLECPAPIHAPGPWEYYRPEHIERSVAALESHRVPLLVLRHQPQFRNAAGYEPEHLRPLEDYVETHYRQVKVFATGDEIWERMANRDRITQ